MKLDPEKLEPFAEGTEKKIYHHPHDGEKLVVEFRQESLDAVEMKGRYYLTKILHLLFPRSIPDISFSQGGEGRPPQIILEKKRLDHEHAQLRDLTSHQQAVMHRGEHTGPITDVVTAKELAWKDRLEADPVYNEFCEAMERMGVNFDTAPRNFGYDDEGNLVYVDNSFFPWSFDEKGAIEVEYGRGLRDAIQKLGGREREQAMAYYDRLEALQKEAIAAQKEKSR